MHQVSEPREVLAKLLDALVAADDAGPADLVRQALAGRFSGQQLRRLERQVSEHRQEFLEAWHDYFGA